MNIFHSYILVIASVFLVTGCGNKVDGNYALDIEATKETSEFKAANQKSNGATLLGLQMLAVIAPTLKIEGGKYQVADSECKLDTDLMKAQCTKADKSSYVINYSLSEGVLKLVGISEEYPVIYKTGKLSQAENKTTPPSPLPTVAKSSDKLTGVWMYSQKKSEEENAKLTLDETQKVMLPIILMSAEANTKDSAGMKITGSQVQDGNAFCSLSDKPDADGFFVCVVQSDRSIHARIKLTSDGNLIYKSTGNTDWVSLIFEKQH